MATQYERDMAIPYEPLARKFAPELYYKEFAPKLHYKEGYISFRGITPSDFEGIYWTAVKSSVPWADVCIQYIIYFKEQRWVSGIFDRVAGKLSGNHPNDYAPIFIYFKNEKPVRTVFDICHYEAVGKIDDHSSLLFKDERPKFIVRGFFRGILPLGDDEGYKRLGGNLNFLNGKRLNQWWNGVTSKGIPDKKAKLIIREKLNNPFQEIKTFLNRSGVLGHLFDVIFKAEKDKKSVPMGDSQASNTPGLEVPVISRPLYEVQRKKQSFLTGIYMEEFFSSEVLGGNVNAIQLNPQRALGRVGVNSIIQRGNYEMSGVYPTIRRGNYEMSGVYPTIRRGNYEMSGVYPTIRRGNYLTSSVHPSVEILLRKYRERNPSLVSKPSSSNTFIHVRSQSGDNVKISRNDFEELTKFVKKNILDRPGVLNYLSFSKTRSIF